MNRNTKAIIWSLCLIVIASVWLLSSLGLFGDFAPFDGFGFWSWCILVAGIASIFSLGSGGFRIFPLAVLLLSVLYFIDFYGVIDVSFGRTVIPAVVLCIALKILVGAVGISGKRKAGDGEQEESVAFSGKCYDFSGKEFSGGSYSAWFSSCRIDLRNAVFAQNDVTLNVTSGFASVEILVPENTCVLISSDSFFGNTLNRTHTGSAADRTLRVKAAAVFGDVRIKN